MLRLSSLPGFLACLVAGTAIAAEPSTTTPPSSAETEFAAFCERYANDAVAQATKNQQQKCGLEKDNADRWTLNRQAHLDWCMSWNGAYAEPAAEGSYRIAGLNECAAKQEAMKDKGALTPGPKVGDILEEAKPPATPAPTPPAGSGAEYATAITPATIYVEPGGAAFKDANGDDIGMSVGSKALVLEKRTNPVWYKLQTKPAGWVWGEDVTLGP